MNHEELIRSHVYRLVPCPLESEIEIEQKADYIEIHIRFHL